MRRAILCVLFLFVLGCRDPDAPPEVIKVKVVKVIQEQGGVTVKVATRDKARPMIVRPPATSLVPAEGEYWEMEISGDGKRVTERGFIRRIE